MNVPRTLRLMAASLLLLLLASPAGYAQLGRLLGRAAQEVARQVDVSTLDRNPPITTSLDDAVWAVDSLDGYTPPEALRSLLALQRTPNGGFVLEPGYFEMHTQSYCLKAGTHGPGSGDGYLFAPPSGPAEDAVVSILRNAVQHPEIEQHDVQVLLWAIIAKAKFEDMDPEIKATAARLLTPQQLAMLNRSALDVLPGAGLDAALERVPAPIRAVLRAEAELRQMMTTPGTSFEQMERAAILAGVPGLGEGSRAVAEGRWSLHPDGYYVRYFPRGYSYTVTQLWVPEGSPAVGREYDPALHIAVPGNTSRQRLIQSARAHPVE